MIDDRMPDTPPLYRQLYETIREGILAGTWQPGERVPSLREAVRRFGASRNTVLNAYQQLCAEGYIENRRKSGFYVADISFDLLRIPDQKAVTNNTTKENFSPPSTNIAYDLSYGNMNAHSFPASVWRKVLVEALYSNGNGASDSPTSYGDPFGILSLRQQIAHYLAQTRGFTCSPYQIVLTSGVQQSIERLLVLFDPSHGSFAMEDPGFPRVRAVVNNARFPLALIPSANGTDAYLSAIEEANPQLIYTTPSHQMPMGTYLKLNARLQLLALAHTTNAYVIEDDYDSVFRFDAQPIPTLKSLDADERVVYLGTFSKILSPALRMGYLVLPESLIGTYHERFCDYQCSAPWVEQEALASFMRKGHWARHVRRVEHAVRRRHQLLVEEMQRQMKQNVELIGADAGLHFLVHVKNGMDHDELISTAAAEGVRVGSLIEYWSDLSRCPHSTVLLSFSSIDEADIPAAVAHLSRAWFCESKRNDCI